MPPAIRTITDIPARRLAGLAALAGLLAGVAIASPPGGSTHRVRSATTASATPARAGSGRLSRPRSRASSSRSSHALVELDVGGPLGRPIPPRYLGMSFEAADLANLARDGTRGDLVGLLRALGPGLLRFGGVTADTRVAWVQPGMPAPSWATLTIGERQLEGLAALTHRSGWSILLTVGLLHYEPTRAAAEVAAAKRILGSSLAGIEIGNEPDSYVRHGVRPVGWGPADYATEVDAYRSAIEAAAGPVALAGPDVSGSGAFKDWGAVEALRERPGLLTGHHYPLGCKLAQRPSIERLLSAATRAREQRSLENYLRIARAYGEPFRIDESGSVSCGGTPGISDTFAAALWAGGYIAQTLAAGAVGVNLQGNTRNCDGYTPLCADSPAAEAAGRLQAQPVWYALLLIRGLAGDRPLHATLTGDGSSDLAVSAFRTPQGATKLLLANDAPRGSPMLELAVESRVGTASSLTLSAPSRRATGAVTLGGSSDPYGHGMLTRSWTAPETAFRGVPRAATLRIAPSSAELVTIER